MKEKRPYRPHDDELSGSESPITDRGIAILYKKAKKALQVKKNVLNAMYSF